ncbi:hypothetical protein C7271_19580, partial [filamentous cyanobacterium CCP5]
TLGLSFGTGSAITGLAIALWLRPTLRSLRQAVQNLGHESVSSRRSPTLGLGEMGPLAKQIDQLNSVLQTSKAQMSDVLDNAFGSLVQLRLYEDNTWTYEFWSAGAQSVFGYSPEAFLTEPDLWRSRVHPDDLPIVTQAAEELRHTGQAYKEYRFHPPDGSVRWIASWSKGRWDDPCGCWRVTITDVDISDLKRLEADLQASQERLRDILNNARACIVRYRIDLEKRVWRYDFWSTGAEFVFGFTAEEFMADNQLWFSRIPPEDIESAIQPSWQEIARGQPYEREYRFRHKDGSLRWISSAGDTRWDAADQCWVVTVVDTDTSERRALAESLRYSQNQLSDILDSATMAVARLRLTSAQEWHYDYFSAGHQRVFGYAPADLIADPHLWLSRLAQDETGRQRFDCLLAGLLRGEEQFVELRFRHANGPWRWIAQHYTCRWDPDGDCWMVISVSQDITDRKTAEEELRRFERVVAMTRDAVALVDRQYVFQIANQTYLERFGVDRDTCIGATIPDLVGQETFERIRPNLERCLAGETVRFELWYDYPAAGRQYISATYSPYQAVDGSIEGVVASFHLLTDLKLAEEALRDSETRFRALAANLPGILYRYVRYGDGRDRFTYMSPGSQVLYGLEPEAIMADAGLLWQAVYPDDVSSIAKSVEDSAQNLTPWQWEGRIIHSSGEVKWIQGRGRPQRYSDGTIVWDGLLIDISERKRHEAERKQAESMLQAERNLLAEVMNTSVAAIVVFNPEAQIIYANNYAEQLLGLIKSDPDQGSYDDPVWQPLTVDDAALSPENQPFWQVLTTGGPVYDVRHAIAWPDGKRQILSVNGAPVKVGQAITRLVFTLSDITDQLAAEIALRRSQERYRLVAENMSDLVCLHQPDGTYLYVTPSCKSLLGYDPEDLIGHNLYEFFHPEDCDRISQNSQILNATDIVAPIVYRMRHREGYYVWLETLSKGIVDPNGQIVQLQTTSRNISEKVEIQQRLEHDAIHDSLTGLPNRSLLMERLDLAIERFHRHPEFGFAVLFLDLDRFKMINDSLGHPVGDDLLVAMAQLLTAQLRSIDLAARLGGDEFVLLLEDVTDAQEVVQVAERILKALQYPFALGHREVFISTSIGIALGAVHYQAGTEILRDADIAMYRAKQDGKARYAIFDPTMHDQVLRAMQLENALRKAIDNGEFRLHYQPIVCLNTGQLQGFEGLIRWQHPSQGLLSPMHFIPIAEETGLIVAMGQWILRRACEQLRRWQGRYPSARSLSVNVNLSARQLKDPLFTEILDQILVETGLSPSCLQLEVTESVLIEDVDLMLANLNAIRARGIQLSIDDFGTGYSSLSYLHRFPFTCIKVDRAFVNDLAINPESTSIITSILTLADSLNLSVVAEGVETAQELSCLRQLKCEMAQGFYFSQPLPPEAVEALLAQDQPVFSVETFE